MKDSSTALKLLVISITTMLALSTVFMTQAIFLEISESFNIDLAQARFSFSFVSIFYAAAFIFLGPIVDKFNLPKIAIIGGISLSLAIFYASYTQNFNLFIISMALTGICAASIPAAMFPHMVSIAPPTKTGMYVGSIVAASTMGVVFGRVSIGMMTANMSWQIAFRILSATILLLALISIFTIIERNKVTSNSKENLLYLYMNSFRLLVHKRTLMLLLAGFFLFFGFLGIVTFLTYRLVAPPFNYAAGDVGLISFAGITALIAPFSGNISQKVGQFKIIFPSLLIAIFAVQLMGWFQPIVFTIISLLLLFFGVYACQPLIFMLMTQYAPKESIGSASSLYILFCIGGGSISSMVLGPIWITYGWIGVTLACTASLTASLFMLAILYLQNKRIRAYSFLTP